jgi:RHS repeat-associated protein
VVGSNSTSYSWDFENRLTQVTLPGSSGTVSFKYDPFGRRIYKSSSSATSIYAYDGDNLIEETNSSGTAVARYSQGLNIDEPLAMLRSSTTSFYDADGLGTVTSLANTAGALAQTYTFDSFGNQTASSGSLTNPFQYTARENDPETGLYYYRARYYDPIVGRFVAEDPAGFRGGLHFYLYTRNKPILFIDPSGLNIKRYAPDPKANTIICNGNGGLEIQLGNLGSPQEKKCLKDCYRAHEASHLADMMKDPDSGVVCQGIARGVTLGFKFLKEHDASEVVASNAEIDCLKEKQKHECAACFQIIIDAIAAAEDYRAKHQH